MTIKIKIINIELCSGALMGTFTSTFKSYRAGSGESTYSKKHKCEIVLFFLIKENSYDNEKNYNNFSTPSTPINSKALTGQLTATFKSCGVRSDESTYSKKHKSEIVLFFLVKGNALIMVKIKF